MNIENEQSKKILDYLNKKPDAGDTLEGITEWWLESERITQEVDRVAAGLETLIRKGLITKVRYKNGNVVYKLTKR